MHLNMSNQYSRATAITCLLICVASLLAACGGSPKLPTPPPQSEFLYSTGLKGITAFPVNLATGMLDSGTLVTSGFTSIALLANMVSDPAGKFLFVCSLDNSSIEGFLIDATTGSLTAIGGSPFNIQGSGGGNLSIDPAGKFLYASTSSGATAFAVNQTTGALSAIVGSPFSDGSVLRASIVAPSGKFLYASGNTTQYTISVFAIDSASGALTPMAGSPFLSPINSEAYSIAVHPSGAFLYVDYPSVNGIAAWSINSTTGMLTLVPGSPFATGNGVPELLASPTGKFLYALNGNDDTVSGFSIDTSSGALTATNGSPFPVSAGTGYLALDPSGQFLYAANGSANDNTIAGFNVSGSTGALAAFSTPPFAGLFGPSLLTVVKPTR
jgi:6-phosphogluconolactonase (cycloisomerase 2 family)